MRLIIITEVTQILSVRYIGFRNQNRLLGLTALKSVELISLPHASPLDAHTVFLIPSIRRQSHLNEIA